MAKTMGQRRDIIDTSRLKRYELNVIPRLSIECIVTYYSYNVHATVLRRSRDELKLSILTHTLVNMIIKIIGRF